MRQYFRSQIAPSMFCGGGYFTNNIENVITQNMWLLNDKKIRTFIQLDWFSGEFLDKIVESDSVEIAAAVELLEKFCEFYPPTNSAEIADAIIKCRKTENGIKSFRRARHAGDKIDLLFGETR